MASSSRPFSFSFTPLYSSEFGFSPSSQLSLLPSWDGRLRQPHRFQRQEQKQKQEQEQDPLSSVDDSFSLSRSAKLPSAKLSAEKHFFSPSTSSSNHPILKKSREENEDDEEEECEGYEGEDEDGDEEEDVRVLCSSSTTVTTSNNKRRYQPHQEQQQDEPPKKRYKTSLPRMRRLIIRKCFQPEAQRGLRKIVDLLRQGIYQLSHILFERDSINLMRV